MFLKLYSLHFRTQVGFYKAKLYMTVILSYFLCFYVAQIIRSFFIVHNACYMIDFIQYILICYLEFALAVLLKTDLKQRQTPLYLFW